MSATTTNGSTTKLRYQQCIGLAIEEEMLRDERVFAMGQDITTLGGQFGLSKALMGKFGDNRVRDTAINETFMIGGACGAAIGGAVPVVDITFSDFLFIAGDEVFNKLAKWRFMHGGHPNELPVTVIAGTGILGGSGAEHNSSIEAHMLHNPGLKVVVPSTPADVKGLLKTAIRDPDPVIFMPNKGMFFQSGQVPDDPDFTIPFGEAATPRAGTSATVVTYSGSVPVVLEAAERLAPEGIDLEVIDLRTRGPARLGDGVRVGAQDQPADDRPRGVPYRRRGRRDRRPRAGGAPVLARVPDRARLRRGHAHPAEPDARAVLHPVRGRRRGGRARPHEELIMATTELTVTEVPLPHMASMETATLTTWSKQVGETVAEGETICEVTTEKVDTEIESPASGVVAAHLYEVGVELALGTVVALLVPPGAGRGRRAGRGRGVHRRRRAERAGGAGAPPAPSRIRAGDQRRRPRSAAAGVAAGEARWRRRTGSTSPR